MALRAGLTAADVIGKLPRVESVLETRPGAARLIPDPKKANRAARRVVRDDPLATPIPWPGSTAASVNEPIVLGRFEDGDPVSIRLVGEHMLTAGTMGRGKSGVLNAIMAELSGRADVVLWGIDMKRGLELAPWRPVLDRLATTEDAALELLTAANRLLDTRADLMAERHERKWQPSVPEPALVLAVDELAELSADGMALLERLARLGRAEGVILVAVTQRPSAATEGGTRLASGVVLAASAESRRTDIRAGPRRDDPGRDPPVDRRRAGPARPPTVEAVCPALSPNPSCIRWGRAATDVEGRDVSPPGTP